MLEIFENKHVGEIPAPFYLDQREVDRIACMLREHAIMLELLQVIEKWDNFPPEERKINAPHGPKAQIEHIRTLVRRFISTQIYDIDK